MKEGVPRAGWGLLPLLRAARPGVGHRRRGAERAVRARLCRPRVPAVPARSRPRRSEGRGEQRLSRQRGRVGPGT